MKRSIEKEQRGIAKERMNIKKYCLNKTEENTNGTEKKYEVVYTYSNSGYIQDRLQQYVNNMIGGSGCT